MLSHRTTVRAWRLCPALSRVGWIHTAVVATNPSFRPHHHQSIQRRLNNACRALSFSVRTPEAFHNSKIAPGGSKNSSDFSRVGQAGINIQPPTPSTQHLRRSSITALTAFCTTLRTHSFFLLSPFGVPVTTIVSIPMTLAVFLTQPSFPLF